MDVTDTDVRPGERAEHAAGPSARQLSARLEPFDSYWQAPDDVEAGYRSFYHYYKANFLPHIPGARDAQVLVVSCGPGYLVNLLVEQGYSNVVGIDSDPEKVAHGVRRGLNCRAARAFEFLADAGDQFDVIVCEQELNHLTLDEMIAFLRLCRAALREEGVLVVYGLNGANPIVGAENLAHNVDHFNTFTEHSLSQVLELAGFDDIELLPLRLYVFWHNPLNYVGLLTTAVISLTLRILFTLYGKSGRIFTKKIAATARKRDGGPT